MINQMSDSSINHSTVRCLLAALSFALAAPAALAAKPETGTPPPPPQQWGIGLMGGYEHKLYKDFDNEALILPMVTYDNRWVSLMGPRLDLKLPSSYLPSSFDPFSFRLRLAWYGNDGYKAEDSPMLQGMSERKGGFWVGPAIVWKAPAEIKVTAEWLADISGYSKGQRVKFIAERDFSRGDWRLTPRLGVEWLDEKYVDYYYGVEANEVRGNRPLYRGDASWNMETGLRLNYAIAPKQTAFVDVSGKYYGTQVEDSPLVDSANSAGVRFGYIYRF